MQHEATLSYFAKYIESELGIIYSQHNFYQLQNRLDEIAKFMGVDSLDKLQQLAQKGITGHFKQMLLDIATNNETSFFRDPKIFKALEQVALQDFIKTQGKTRELKIWSAAASTGQEALTVAMTIKEWCKRTNSTLPFSILGSDISQRVLDRAQAAKYTQLEVQRGLPAPFLIKYFKKDSQDMWQALPELTQHTTFKKMNLKEPFMFSHNFDIILCRNILIYQSIESKKDILLRMTRNLAPGGFLILGSGESLLGLSQDYDQCQFEGAVIYRKKLNLMKAAS